MFRITQTSDMMHQPILAPLLYNRTTSGVIVGAGVLHLGLTALGLPSWSCPLLQSTGIPCPGCGLSRAINALWHGQWQESITYHALAVPFIMGLGIIAIAAVLPVGLHQQLVKRVEGMEQKTGVIAYFLVLLVVYWLARLAVLQGAYLNLMLGTL